MMNFTTTRQPIQIILWPMRQKLYFLLSRKNKVKYSRLKYYAETIFYYIYTILHQAGEEHEKTSDRNKIIGKRKTP